MLTPTASAPHMAQGQLHAECGQALRLIMHEREENRFVIIRNVWVQFIPEVSVASVDV